MDLRSFLKPNLWGIHSCGETCWSVKVMNFLSNLKLTLPWHGKSERVLTHCTLGVPLKCQARVERLVATRSQTA